MYSFMDFVPKIEGGFLLAAIESFYPFYEFRIVEPIDLTDTFEKTKYQIKTTVGFPENR